MDRNNMVAALRRRAGDMASLDTPEDQDALGLGLDIGAGFLPGVGTALAARDLERARREDDWLGMGLSALGMVPVVGGVARGVNTARRVGNAARKYPNSEAAETARRNAVEMLGLPEDNTAMDRARALGFETPAVHFSRKSGDYTELDSALSVGNAAVFENVGTHMGTPEAALERAEFLFGPNMERFDSRSMSINSGPTSYPVLIRSQRPFLDAGEPWREDDLMTFLEELGNSPLIGQGVHTPGFNAPGAATQRARQKLFGERSQYTHIPYINAVEDAGSISYIVPPQNIRSRHAAFDPARAHESDLLGYATPEMLMLLAGGSLGTAGLAAALRAYRSEEDQPPQEPAQGAQMRARAAPGP